jgi:hypothetical protein
MIDRSRDALLDFIYDRGAFAAAGELDGMAVSQKPDLFVSYYHDLGDPERATMNAMLISALLGSDKDLAKFGGIVLILILAVLQRTSATGLEVFRPELLQELDNPKRRQSWLEELDHSAEFRQDWRYPLGIIRILGAFRTPEVLAKAGEMARLTRSSEFRQKLEEFIADIRSR